MIEEKGVSSHVRVALLNIFENRVLAGPADILEEGLSAEDRIPIWILLERTASVLFDHTSVGGAYYQLPVDLVEETEDDTADGGLEDGYHSDLGGCKSVLD